MTHSRRMPQGANGRIWPHCGGVLRLAFLTFIVVLSVSWAHVEQPRLAAVATDEQPGATLASMLMIAKELSPQLASRAVDKAAARARVKATASLPDPVLRITLDDDAVSLWRTVLDYVTAESFFGIVAVSCVLLWPFLPTRVGAVLTQGVGAGAFALHFLLLGSATAAVASCMALLQLIATALISRRAPLCLAYSASVVVLAGLTVVTWHGLPSMFASAGSLLATLARLQQSTTRMKVGFLISGPFWAVHNILVGSIFGITVDFVSIGTNVAALSLLGSQTNPRSSLYPRLPRRVELAMGSDMISSAVLALSNRRPIHLLIKAWRLPASIVRVS